MAKRPYRSININQIDIESLAQRAGTSIIVGIDIAKEKQFAAFESRETGLLRIVQWSHPRQTPAFVDACSELAELVQVEVVMEPSGTYGDSIRHALLKAGLRVFRVQPKHTSDAAEFLDGVPSIHDAKSAVVIARVHSFGRSAEWPLRTEAQRDLKARLQLIEMYSKQAARNRNRLENLTAAYWPELGRILTLESATFLELLIAFPDPRVVARRPKKVKAFMRKVGGHALRQEKIEAVVESAGKTVGVPMSPVEAEVLSSFASEARQSQLKAAQESKKLVESNSENASLRPMTGLVGIRGAAVVITTAGDPRDYPSAKALVKALGLNLKVRSSGTCRPGRPALAKRGSSMARRLLYMAALRLLQFDPIVKAWYRKKVRRSPGSKRIATVAVMRKLALALWHVARGARFDSRKLFDTSRLSLEACP